jgi:aspartyl-tRNA synthetase
VWITGFPLFEATEDGEITSSHHPFTAPDRTDFDPHNIEDLLSLRSRAYDLVVNGEELGGGSIRISDREVQRKIFTALGLTEEETKEKFGFFLRAFDFGPPPHGGLALGMDRTISMILGTSSIREVIAFPKNRSAACPLTGAPSAVNREQLAELELFDLGKKEVLPGTTEQENDIDRISWVARIGISEQERPAMQDILTRAEDMAKAAAARAGSETPIRSVAPAVNRTRPGTEAFRSPLAKSGRFLENAPAVKGNYFKVASILE